MTEPTGKYIVAVGTPTGTYYIKREKIGEKKTGLEHDSSKAELVDTRMDCALLIIDYIRDWVDGKVRHFAFVFVPFSRQLDWDKRQTTWFGKDNP